MKRQHLPHLTPERFIIRPGSEWRIPLAGWWLIHICSGSGYVLSHSTDASLEPTGTIRVSPLWNGTLRASQLSRLELCAVRFDWFQLLSLITAVEEQFFKRAESDPEFALLYFPPTSILGNGAGKLFQGAASSLAFRVAAISLFLETLGSQFADDSLIPLNKSAGERIKQLLAETPTTELVHLESRDLVRRANCTSRHLRRIFRELFGVSFREKQAQIRLDRAVQLLSRSENKIVDVALESGFSSVSLFNAHFKRRFHVPPRYWRDALSEDKNQTPP